jgi:hypothetical protein
LSRARIIVPAACLLAACASGTTVTRAPAAVDRESCYVGRRLPTPASPAPSHDKQTLAPLILRHAAEVRRCYEAHGLPGNPALGGRVVFRWLISETGRVAWSGVQESSLGSEAVEACIGESLCNWTFPPTDGGGTTVVDFPFTFTPLSGMLTPRVAGRRRSCTTR